MVMGGIALALLLGALGFQYIGHLAPCEMCHWQRWPHIAAAVIGLGVVQIWHKQARLLAILAIILVAISGLIGAYQAAMQWHLVPGPSACSGARYVLGSNVVPEIQCDVVTFRLFGLSLAVYNGLISLSAAAMGFLMLRKG